MDSISLTAVDEHSRVRVLHIDDEEEQLIFAKLFLEEADPGFEIVSVATPRELFDELDASVDCVVADYIMPEMDGVELCWRVKQKASVPVIIYTGRGSEVVAEAAFKSGVDDYVRKEIDPIHYQVLAKRIRSHSETYKRLREQTTYQERLENLRSNLHILTEARNIKDVADTTFHLLEWVFGYRDGSFWVFKDLMPVLVHSYGSDIQGFTFQDIDTGVIQEVQDDENLRVVVPLRDNELVGAFVIDNPDNYSTYDTRLLEFLGLLVAQSIHRIDQMEQIQASEEQFRSIVENVQDVIVLTRPEGVISYISPSCLDIFGYNPDTLVSKQWSDLVHDDDLPKLEEFYNRAQSGERGSINEYRILTNLGDIRWVQHSWTPLMSGGEVKLVVNAVNDITWRKNTETALQTSLEELEQTNRDLNDFTHIVSHDLKAPLMTIESFSSFLLEDYGKALDETGRDFLNKVIEGSDRMVDLIDNLLTLSRIGRKFTDYNEVDLNQLVKTVLEDLQGLINETGAVVSVGSLPSIIGQEVWLNQLFLNLIGNGIKFNESKPPRVEVGYTELDEMHHFTVKDNGIGIPEDQTHLLFRVFQRLATEKPYPGTGAGLSICKKIVESMGGNIGVESTKGFGTTFYFTIPKDLPVSRLVTNVPEELTAEKLSEFL
ncbi:MAG: PAS domain S-box protein [Candidatus Bathyarchaeota archaeon]|nr:PAS domain S-box protein [Candidatus Bathyarchaeota archaeon]